MTDTQKNAIAQAAERLFDFADDFIPQPTSKAAQDFTDPENYWHQAALAALPQPAPVTGGEDALREALGFVCMTLAFIGRDRGTDRIEATLDGICTLATETEALIRKALSPIAPEAPSEREKLIAELVELVEALEDARNNGFGEAFFRLHVDTLITRARKIGGAS